MNKINKTIKVPFGKISYKATFAKKEKMNELETLIMVLIVTSTELGLKKETLGEAIELKYGIKNKTIEIIKESLNTLLKSQTIPNKDKANSNSLLKTNIRIIKASLDKEIISDIQNGEFNKKSLSTRKIFETIYETAIPNTKTPETIKESKHDGAWTAPEISEAVALEIADDDARSKKKDSETLSTFEIDKNETKLVYLDSTIEFNKSDSKIFGTNNLFKTVFKEIELGNFKLEELTKMLDTSVEGIEFKDQDGISIENINYTPHTIDGNQYIELNDSIMQLFNKSITYKIEETKQELNVNEIYAAPISTKDFCAILLKDGNIENLNKFNKSNKELRDYFLGIKLNSKNMEFVRYYFEKEPFKSKISNKDGLFNKLYEESDLREMFQNTSKAILEENIVDINNFIVSSKFTSLYELTYRKLDINYNKNTSIFPGWNKEISFNGFINDLDKIEAKINMIVQKKDAEEVLVMISKYEFNPIKSKDLKNMEIKIKKMIQTAPSSGISDIKFYGSQVRMMLEKLVSKTDGSIQFIDKLNDGIKEGKINKKDKSSILEIYKRSNAFHHNSELVIDAKLEEQVKKDIIKVTNIAKENKADISEYNGGLKWATV
ncbi:MAG: hypothetical protein KAG14_01340 [Mycoplasmataceae bacterium]|nr:hypothetical protein [Mycoplasmataceae bacterium]